MAPAITFGTTEVEIRDGVLVPRETVLHDGEIFETALFVRTRTGVKIHTGWGGSSVTGCGVWLRTNGSRMAVASTQVAREHLCENCFNLDRIAPVTA